MRLKIKAPQSSTFALEAVWGSKGIFFHPDRQQTVISDGISDSQLTIWSDGSFGNHSISAARHSLALNGWTRLLPTDTITITVQGA